MKLIPTLTIALLLSACASQPARLSSTPWPQAVMSASKDQVRDDLVQQLTSKGLQIDEISSSMVKVQTKATAAHQALLSCAVCPPPYYEISYVLADQGQATMVSVQYWLVIPGAGGSAERQQLTDSTTYNSYQAGLWKMRDRIAAGS